MELIDLLVNCMAGRITNRDIVKILKSEHSELFTPLIAYNIMTKCGKMKSETSMEVLEILAKDNGLLKEYAFARDFRNFDDFSTLDEKEFILNNIDTESGMVLINNWKSIKIQYKKLNLKNKKLNEFAKRRVDSILVADKLKAI